MKGNGLLIYKISYNVIKININLHLKIRFYYKTTLLKYINFSDTNHVNIELKVNADLSSDKIYNIQYIEKHKYNKLFIKNNMNNYEKF